MEVSNLRRSGNKHMGHKQPHIKIGCCGFPVAKARYFQTFSVVELQKTFYQLPLLRTAQKWKEEAPKGFEFTMKAPQLITHETTSPTYRRYRIPIPEGKRANYGSFKPTKEVMDAWQHANEIARALGARLVVFQSPPSFTPTEEHKKNLIRFFASIERNSSIMVWEPRDGWKSEEVKALCEEAGIIHCVDPFKSEMVHGRPAYFRLHGKTGYRYRFSEDDLRWLKGLFMSYETVYCMFNNIAMFEDACRFKDIIAKE